VCVCVCVCVSRLRQAEIEMQAAAAAKREAALKSELQAMKLGQLCTRAINGAVDSLALEQAQDSDAPKEAVIALLLKAAGAHVPEEASDRQLVAEGGDGQAETEAMGLPADHSCASSSPASNPTEPNAGDLLSTTVLEGGKTVVGERSAKRGRRGRRTMQLSCPQCSEDFNAHAPVKQKRTRKSRCGGEVATHSLL
jgi:hypothetical protein